MKALVLLIGCCLMSSSTALADHIGVYSDNTGSSCQLGPAGQLNSGATVIHKFAAGATGSWFDIELPPATSFFSFSSPFSPIPNVTTDGIALDYRHCLTGSIVLGTINAIYGAGVGHVIPADQNPDIIYLDCSSAPLSATGGTFYVGDSGTDCGETNPVEPSTWGSVKALYR